MTPGVVPMTGVSTSPVTPSVSRPSPRNGYAIGDMAISVLSRSWRVRLVREHDTVCQRTPVPRHRRHGHRPAQTQGGRRRSRRSMRSCPVEPVVVGGQSYGGRVASLAAAEPGRAVRGTGPVQLSVASARLARQGGGADRPLGRRSAARSLLLSGESDPSRRSTCCALRSRDSVDRPSSSPTRGSATGSCPCSTTCSIASPRSSPSTHGLHLLPCPDPRPYPVPPRGAGGCCRRPDRNRRCRSAQPTAPQPVDPSVPDRARRSMRSPHRSGRKEPHCAS